MADVAKGLTDPTVDLDTIGKGLQLDAEKAKYLETIAKSQQGVADAKASSLKGILPAPTGAPQGVVTLGDKAGAFGPWRAHQIIDAVAQQIASRVHTKVGKDAERVPRVLVVDNRCLLESDWTARHVRLTLERLCRRMGALKSQVRESTNSLAEAVGLYTDEEARSPSAAAPQGGRRGAPTPPGAATAAPTAVGVPGALGAAVDLLGLLRTDYTLTASNVSPGLAELVTLTSAHLAVAGLSVEADVFSTMRASPSSEKLTALLNDRDDIVDSLLKMQQGLAPVEDELSAISARVAIIEQEWAKAAANAKGELTPATLRQTADALAWQARHRERAAGPARAMATYAQRVVADIDAAVATLLQAPEGGEAPLFTAARRERLEEGADIQDVITHVLYVTLDAVAADAVTRRSTLGASGVLRFLAAANASWLLLDTSTGTIVGGQQESLADVMTFSLETGAATYDDKPRLKPANGVIKDPYAALETSAKVLVLVLTVVLVILGVLSILAVIHVVLG